MNKAIDMTGKVFGKLKVVERAGSSHDGRALWKCKCLNCGKVIVATGRALRSGDKKSCGCLVKEVNSNLHKTHGKTGSRLYRIWSGMKDRCLNKSLKDYKNYGGRGISVCSEWLNNFEVFNKWAMENGYQENLTIDRINVNGNYEPNNCRWVTQKEQANNTRFNVYITYEGRTQTMKMWCEEFGINYWTVQARHLDHPELTPEELFEESKEDKNLTYKGKTQTIMQWSKELNIPVNTIYNRIYRKGEDDTDYILDIGDKRNCYLTYKGVTKSQAQWARELCIPVSTLKSRKRKHPEYTVGQLLGFEK